MDITRGLSTVTLLLGLCVTTAAAQEREAASALSLDDLLNIEISAAAKYAQTASEAAASVTVITRDDIQRYGYHSLAEALVQVRGFYGSYDRNYFYLGARGFGRPTDYNNRILLLLDGQPLNENFYSSATLGGDFALNMEMMERIEVVRGPGSALYGSSAMFGVVNIVSRTGRDVQGIEVKADVGSFGQKRGSAVWGREFDNGLQLMATGNWTDATGQDLYFPEFDDPSTNNGLAEGLDWEQSAGGYAVASYGPFSVHGFLMKQKKGVPTAAWETLFNVDQNTWDQLSSVDARFEQELGVRGKVTARAYSAWYDYEGVYPYEEEYAETDGNVGRWYGMEAKAQVDLTPSNRLTFGSEARRNTEVRYFLRAAEDVYFDQSFPFSLISAYVQDELHLRQDLVATVGGRLDHHSDVGTAVTPRAALVYHPREGSTLKALYGEAFRAPNAYELHYEDDWGSISNPSLDPERVRTMEVVVEQRLAPSWFGSVSLFDYAVTDLIDQVETEGELYQFQNQGEVDARGVEFELTTRTESGFVGYVSHIFQSTRNRADGERLTNSPRYASRAGASYPLTRDVTLSATVLHDGERMTLHGTTADSFVLANLTLVARGLSDRLQASVSVRNIFDASYGTPGGWEHSMATIQQDGRTFVFSVGMGF